MKQVVDNAGDASRWLASRAAPQRRTASTPLRVTGHLNQVKNPNPFPCHPERSRSGPPLRGRPRSQPARSYADNRVTRYRQVTQLILVYILTISQLLAQNSPLTGLQTQLDAYRKETLQEKLFVHTDRSFYMAGELIWCRLFYVDGTQHQPLNVSKVAYVELIDKDQKAVLQTKMALDTGRGMGSLLLPTTLVSGQYVVRAYTQWMKSVSPEFLFEKAVTIVNPFRKLGQATPTDSLAADVQFFPEGGNLVSGLPAKVAFKVVDGRSGRGIDCRGWLLNQANDTLARFSSLRFGMGTFAFTPSAGTTYRVLLRDAKNSRLIRSLPASYQTGYTMEAADDGAGQLRITVRTNKLDAAAVYLIGHTRQVVNVAVMKELQHNEAQFLIPKNTLGDGISHLTLFDATGQPLCERLVFNRPRPGLQLQLTPNQQQYATRSPVTVAIEAKNAPTNAPAQANLSVAVYRIDSLQPGETTTLPQYLWLTSDLRGTVESPDYYFSHTDTDADLALDNLMLTHGWRRFRWENVTQPKPMLTTNVPEHRGVVVQGRVTNVRTGAPVNDATVYLSIPGKAIRLYALHSNAQGLVRFELTDFVGTKDIVMQTAPPDSSLRVEVLNPYTETPALTPLPDPNLTQTAAGDLTERSMSMQVQNSYFNQYATPRQPPLTDSTAFFGTPDEHYNLDAYTRFTVLDEVLSEYVPGVIVRKQNRRYALRVNNLPYREVFPDAPLMLLDGVPIFDMDQLMAFSPLKLKTLDVITRRYFLGYSILPGIISFRTYKSDLAGFPVDPRAVVLEYDGLQTQREFYAPRYATPAQQASRLPDFRNLLHWNPQVTTSPQGKATISFYTSDQEGTYLVVAQGITSLGQPANTQQIIVVRGGVK